MSILLLGQNHRTAPVELREQLAFDDEKVQRLGALLKEDGVLQEAVVVSTCNRAEIYAVGGDSVLAEQRLAELLERVHGLPLHAVQSSLYRQEDASAVRHLFRVASGLDSMVLGEGQILSQVKKAYAPVSYTHLTLPTKRIV